MTRPQFGESGLRLQSRVAADKTNDSHSLATDQSFVDCSSFDDHRTSIDNTVSTSARARAQSREQPAISTVIRDSRN